MSFRAINRRPGEQWALFLRSPQRAGCTVHFNVLRRSISCSWRWRVICSERPSPSDVRFRSRASGSKFNLFRHLFHSPARAPELTGILRNGSSTGRPPGAVGPPRHTLSAQGSSRFFSVPVWGWEFRQMTPSRPPEAIGVAFTVTVVTTLKLPSTPRACVCLPVCFAPLLISI